MQGELVSPVVRFQPGQVIDTSKVLEIIGLARDSSYWRQIEEAYPEVQAAGPRASFRGWHNVTIYSPTFTSKQLLKRLVTYGDDKRHVYPLTERGQIVAVLIHVEGARYASVHIYRLKWQ